MFKYQPVRTIFTVAIFTSLAVLPANNASAGKSEAQAKAELLIASLDPAVLQQMLVLAGAAQAAPAEAVSASAQANGNHEVTPVSGRTKRRRPHADTPGSCERLPAARRAGLDMFASPTAATNSNTIYIQGSHRLRFAKIDLQGQQITKEGFLERLRSHPQYAQLIRLRHQNLPRYVGKCADKENRGRTSRDRAMEEARDAANGGRSRHARGIREGTLVHQDIFINIDPAQWQELETWMIEELDANWGNGLNSNSGSTSQKSNNDDDDGESEELDEELQFELRYHDSKRSRKDKDDDDDTDSRGSGGGSGGCQTSSLSSISCSSTSQAAN